MRKSLAPPSGPTIAAAQPLTVAPHTPLSMQEARARRSARAFDGWLSSRMRVAAAARRRAAGEGGRLRPRDP